MDRLNDDLIGLPKTKPARKKEATEYKTATKLAELTRKLRSNSYLASPETAKTTAELSQLIRTAHAKHALKASILYLKIAPSQHVFFQDGIESLLARRIFPAVGPLCDMASRLIKADNGFAAKACHGVGRILSVSLPTADTAENKDRLEAACTLLTSAPELAERFSSAALSTLGHRRPQPSLNAVRTLELHLPEITERAPVCIPFIAQSLVALLEDKDPCKAEDAIRLILKMAQNGPHCAAEIARLLSIKPAPPQTPALPHILAALASASAAQPVQSYLHESFMAMLAQPDTPDGLAALQAAPLFLKGAPHLLSAILPLLSHALKSSSDVATKTTLTAFSRFIHEAPLLVEPCAMALLSTTLNSPTPHPADIDALTHLLKGTLRPPAAISIGLKNLMETAAQHTNPNIQAASCRLMTARHISNTMTHARSAAHHLPALIASPHKNVSDAALRALPSLCVAFRKASHTPILQTLLEQTVQHLPATGKAPPHVQTAIRSLSAIFSPLYEKPQPIKKVDEPLRLSKRFHILDLLK